MLQTRGSRFSRPGIENSRFSVEDFCQTSVSGTSPNPKAWNDSESVQKQKLKCKDGTLDSIETGIGIGTCMGIEKSHLFKYQGHGATRQVRPTKRRKEVQDFLLLPWKLLRCNKKVVYETGIFNKKFHSIFSALAFYVRLTDAFSLRKGTEIELVQKSFIFQLCRLGLFPTLLASVKFTSLLPCFHK